MMCILTIIRWSRFTICCMVMTIACQGIAQEAMWVPKLGTITTLQPTDIKLISQKIEFVNLAPLTLQNRQVWGFEGEAEFSLQNTTRSKKKPTILIRLCTLNERFNSESSCGLKEMDLTIKADGRELDWSPFLKGRDVFARFSLKFGPKMGRKVMVNHRLFERGAGDHFADTSTYLTFDYHLEDSAAWDGPVGSTYFSAKLPFKADAFNGKAFSNGDRFLYKNRFAYFSRKKMKWENDDGLSFYVITASYRFKVDRFRRRLRAIPNSPKRQLALASVLAAYPGAHKQIEKHVRAAMKKQLKDWSEADIGNATTVYSKYLIELNKFKETQIPCDDIICISKSTLEKVIDNICRSNRCTENNKKELAACCAPKDSQQSRDYMPGNAIESMDTESDTDEGIESQPTKEITRKKSDSDIGGFMLRYAFLLFMAALGFIGLISWIIVQIRHRDKPTPYRKTLHD